MESVKALKLDCSFRPVDIIDAVEALVLCIVGKAHAIETHTAEIRSVTQSFQLPSIIVLKRYVKFRFHSLACTRANLLWRDQNQCQYCAKSCSSDVLTIDHVIPKSRGGQNTWTNLVIACKKCNQKKGNKTPAESGMILIRKPAKPKTSILRFLTKGEISPTWKDYLWNIG
jgi:5-methylcytosine-specific restriction endonuclease McrA